MDPWIILGWVVLTIVSLYLIFFIVALVFAMISFLIEIYRLYKIKKKLRRILNGKTT